MAYATTTIESSTPAVTLMAWLDTQLTGNGWTAVETWTSSTKVANIYLSPAGSNELGVDFYVSVYRASDTSSVVYFSLFEEWDAVNKKKLKYAPQPSNTLTCNTDGSVNDTGVAPDAQHFTFSVPLNVSVVYHLVVDVNHIILGSSNTAATATQPSFIYVGVFDRTLSPTVDPMPLCVTTSWITSTAPTASVTYRGSVTREIGQPSPGWANWAVNPGGCDSNVSAGHSEYCYAYAPQQYTTAGQRVLPTSDIFRPNAAAKVWIGSARGANPYAAIRGVLKSVVTSRSGNIRGDTLQVAQTDGSTKSYVLVTVNDSSMAKLFIPNE